MNFNIYKQSGSIVTLLVDNSEKVGEKVGEKHLTTNRKQIMRAIEKNNNITIKELAQIIGIAEKNVENNIKVLKEAGLIKRIGPPKGGYWEVVQ